MSWNGSGVFNRIYSWVADKNAGIDITASRTDADTNDITSNGFGNTLTRDGQGSASANLPMNNFRHTGVGNAQARTDYPAAGQVQDALLNWTIAGGTADAITATYTPAVTALVDGQELNFRATAANATTAPTFAPNGLTAHTITKLGGQPLQVGDIAGNLAECDLRYNLANTRWELLNPATSTAWSTGDVKPTFKTAADSGFVMMNDGSIGNDTSGGTTLHSTAQAAALFSLLWTNISNTWCQIQDSTGAPTTRGVSAAADFTASKRMPLPLALGRALAISGAGSGLTSRTLGQNLGEETHLLTNAEIALHTHSITEPNGGTGHIHPLLTNTLSVTGGTAAGGGTSGNANNFQSATGAATTGITINSAGGATPPGGIAHNNMQPTSFLNVMIKL